jgi:hypothetical protein
MSYRTLIEAALARAGRADVNPAHVEAHMRAEHGTLDHLAPAAFRRRALAVIKYVDAMNPEDNDKLARSYGLR